jgi:hypothetical protein
MGFPKNQLPYTTPINHPPGGGGLLMKSAVYRQETEKKALHLLHVRLCQIGKYSIAQLQQQLPLTAMVN